MSERFPGGVISKTAPVPTGPFENGTAPGIWTLEQQAEFVKQGIWPIAGNVPPYIEDVFSTWLYTGNGTTQTINNGIDLAGKGGMVWGKTRDAVVAHTITDTVRGVDKEIFPNLTDAQQTRATGTGSVFAFNSNGFSTSGVNGFINYSGLLEVAWTFREQAKFFDIVTYTGNGVNGRTIAHNLGSVPGCIIFKRLNASSDWSVYHRSNGATKVQWLQTNDPASTDSAYFNNTEPTSTVFSVGTDPGTNANGGTYVAYLFAHNAGGFGATQTDNVITCGSYTGNGSTTGPTVTLGYEPQWVLLKNATTGTTEWVLLDNMRGMAVTGNSQYLRPNSSGAESGFENFLAPTATGFQVNSNDGWINTSGNTYIYIAIRRGPMRTPTTGTSVFSPNTATDTEGQGTVKTTNFPVDLQITKSRASSGNNWTVDRLRGVSTTATDTGPSVLITNSTDAQSSGTFAITRAWNNTGFQISSAIGNSSQIYWNFRRAPGFFDEVCYTGTGTARTVAHNLGVVPEMMIVKNRSGANGWTVYVAPLGNSGGLILNETSAFSSAFSFWNNTDPTASVFTLNLGGAVNGSGSNYVNYLFASCPGVSKVGSYTGTGTTQVINCGFTGGARFVLIKSTSTTGNWLVWDSARGIVAGNDPYLALNSTAAEVTNTDWVDTAASGFELSNAGGNLANSSGVNYIFLAIA